MPSDEMVEKVARALCRLHIQNVARYDNPPPTEDRIQAGVDNCWQHHTEAARAALTAAMGETEPVADGDEEAQCYPVHLAWSEEDEAWIATSPDLPGCCAVGDSRHDAVREMQGAIFAWIDAAKEAGRSIPKATLSKPPEWVRASPSEAAIRADEREKCAKVAERFPAAGHRTEHGFLYGPNTKNAIATAIRARGGGDMIKTTPWDSAHHLVTDRDILEYLLAAIDEDDIALIRYAAAKARAALLAAKARGET